MKGQSMSLLRIVVVDSEGEKMEIVTSEPVEPILDAWASLEQEKPATGARLALQRRRESPFFISGSLIPFAMWLALIVFLACVK